MKRILFAIAVILFAIYGQDLKASESEELLRAYSGTKLIFKENIELYEGQKRVPISECSLRLQKPSTGFVQIKKGSILIISLVEKHPVRESFNPQTGKRFKVPGYLKIHFRGLKTKLKCPLLSTGPMTFKDLEADGKISLKSPEDIVPYVFE